MSKSYDEIMEEIQVTDEMRDRILQNITKTEIQRQTTEKKKIYFCRWQKYSLTVACLAILLIGAATLPKLWSGNGQESQATENTVDEGELLGGFTIEMQECSSVEALSKAAGFPMKELGQLPFTKQDTCYSYLGDGLAEIRYYGEGEEELDYRKSIGTEDNSGVYQEFDEVREEEINGVPVTFKGEENKVYLILWQKDDYSYSVYKEDGIFGEEVTDYLEDWIQ